MNGRGGRIILILIMANAPKLKVWLDSAAAKSA